MKSLSKGTKKQMFGFAVTGLSSTLIMYGLYIVLYQFINYQYAYFIAYSISVLVLYFMNSFVFKKPPLLATFFQFPLVYLFQYAVSAAFLAISVRLGFSVTYAPLLVIIVLLPVTFLLNQLIFSRH
jgi:putative flippase GtrA